MGRKKPKAKGRARRGRTNTEIEADIEAQLREFLAGREVWPSYREFVAAGRRPLREALGKRRGAHYWARRVGVRWVKRPPGYAARWTEERVSKELEAFLAGRDVWPPAGEFQAAGLGLLREAVKRLGGVEVWAEKFGLARPNHSLGSTRIWDHERLEQSIGPLIRYVGRWPTKSEFRQAGLESALGAVYRHRGIEYWRKHFGLPAKPKREAVRARRVWTEERIERELGEYCAGRSEWPTQREFVADGKGGLYKAASLHGGIGRWQKQLGLRAPRRTYPGARTTRHGSRS
ncbi:MAG TPA: hypothetical protein VMF09_07380 [Solirubrobacteraceae bacterium]|nr:hypothetical protein [Solirubrobacteraceae bacterium]